MLMIVTGLPGSGKSTLCQRILDSMGWNAGGFLTRPIFTEGERIGFDLFLLEEGKIHSSSFPIARINRLEEFTIFPETFTQKGVLAIEKSLEKHHDCIVMDEIGRFEKDNEIFLSKVWMALNQKQIPVIIVLKKENLSFNLKVWNLTFGLHLDLDVVDREEAYQRAKDYFRKRMVKP